MVFIVNYKLLMYSFVGLFIFCFLLFFIFNKLIEKDLLNNEKLSIYECGFEPFEDRRIIFEIKFYLVAILFLIFDLEIILLFPWVLVAFSLNFMGIISIIMFYFLLSLIYIYEWLLGSLQW